MNGSPIFDVKPYLAYTDSHPEATGGFSFASGEGTLAVDFPDELLRRIPPERGNALCAVLAQDPRPAYQEEPGRVYGMEFGGFEIRFVVKGGRLTVREVLPDDTNR